MAALPFFHYKTVDSSVFAELILLVYSPADSGRWCVRMIARTVS